MPVWLLIAAGLVAIYVATRPAVSSTGKTASQEKKAETITDKKKTKKKFGAPKYASNGESNMPISERNNKIIECVKYAIACEQQYDWLKDKEGFIKNLFKSNDARASSIEKVAKGLSYTSIQKEVELKYDTKLKAYSMHEKKIREIMNLCTKEYTLTVTIHNGEEYKWTRLIILGNGIIQFV